MFPGMTIWYYMLFPGVSLTLKMPSLVAYSSLSTKQLLCLRVRYHCWRGCRKIVRAKEAGNWCHLEMSQKLHHELLLTCLLKHDKTRMIPVDMLTCKRDTKRFSNDHHGFIGIVSSEILKLCWITQSPVLCSLQLLLFFPSSRP